MQKPFPGFYRSLNMNTDDVEEAKAYMARKELVQLFESLVTGLVHNRPEDPVSFMEQCLQRVKQKKEIKWDSFLSLDDEKEDKSAQTDAKNFEKLFQTEPESK
ncbi:adenylate kinase isoenzyme 5-like [Actinia tenebrosa]|uniref:Adenylate kinase isoenzyme 5-like n=1 Tax=Actinia tenebrosa TaxID=6105 RepID=A0A6P8H3P2_ACTTE|nr:adenylate kinase isoenzyme 5-like [Actinia tenebrosa]